MDLDFGAGGDGRHTGEALEVYPEHLLSSCCLLGYNLWRVRSTQSPCSKPEAGLPLEHPLRVIFLLSFFSLYFCHAVWSSFPDQGANPYCLQWNHEVLTIGPPGQSLTFLP